MAQCVRDADIAWHAGNWKWNKHSIGIEHEGYAGRRGAWSDALYLRRRGSPRTSANVMAYLLTATTSQGTTGCRDRPVAPARTSTTSGTGV